MALTYPEQLALDNYQLKKDLEAARAERDVAVGRVLGDKMEATKALTKRLDAEKARADNAEASVAKLIQDCDILNDAIAQMRDDVVAAEKRATTAESQVGALVEVLRLADNILRSKVAAYSSEFAPISAAIADTRAAAEARDAKLVDDAKARTTALDQEQLNKARAHVKRLMYSMELAWGIIANAGQGDWSRETEAWALAAANWRDEHWHRALAKTGGT